MERNLGNVRGKQGIPGENGKSAYDLAVSKGFSGTEEEWLEYLKGEPGQEGPAGADGLSAYEVAVSNGFSGTEEEWLASLKGEPGQEAPDGVSAEDVKDAIFASLNGVTLKQDAEGNWGYFPPGADAVIPFSRGGMDPKDFFLGSVPADTVGTMWFEPEDGETVDGAVDGIALLSSVPADAENGLWCGDGEPFSTITVVLPSVPREEIGAMWIE